MRHSPKLGITDVPVINIDIVP